MAADLSKQITALKAGAEKAGEPLKPVDLQSISQTIANAIRGSKGTYDLSKFKSVAENTDPSNVVVQPNMLKEEEELDEPEKEKTGEEAPEETPEETPETGEETPEVSIETGEETPEETPFEFGKETGEEVPEETPEETPEVNFFGKDSQSLGGGVVKPDGAPTTIKIEPDKSVEITMNEAKIKLIKQIAEGVNSYMNEISIVGKNKNIIVDKSNKTTGIVNKTGKLNGKDTAKQGKYMAKPVSNTKKFTKTTEVMSESEQKLRKYIRTRLQEKAGIIKPSLNEGKKSETLKKLDTVIDNQFKLFESVVLKKKDNLNEVFGFSTKEKVANLDPNDQAGVENLFNEVFKLILTNPQLGAIGRAARKTPTNAKYELLKQYVENGGGTLRTNSDGMLVLVPESVKSNATKSNFDSGGTQGHTAMGGI